MSNVLIVEDMIIIAEDIKSVVTGFGHKVVGIAVNSRLAKKIAVNNNVDVALIDINLEGNFEGILLAKVLNSKYGINIIFISAYDEKEIVDVNYEFRFLSKPYSEHKLHELMDKIEKCVD